jgi:restriction system protein
MPTPDFQSFFYPFLKLGSDSTEHSLKEAREYLTKYFNLSEEDIAEKVPSGTQTKFDNRIYWTKSYFSKAKLIESTKRSHFKITDRGLVFFSKFTDNIRIADLKQFEEFIEFTQGANIENGSKPISYKEDTTDTKTPLEKLEESYLMIQKELANELLEKIYSSSWQFFEDLVVELMVKMGYGGSRFKAGQSIRTNDKGIDGIIDEDKLGLNSIYIQAKKWSKEQCVGRPDVQRFVGALQGQRAKKGVFITSSYFSDNAFKYVNSIDSKIILIDGSTLADLMIEYGVGTTTIASYHIKRVDLDFFEE